jgi:hypothetical protein
MNEKRQQVRQMLDSIKAQYQLKYGIEMDDWFAINVAEIKEHFNMIRRHLDANSSESKRLHETFKGSVKSVSFTSDRQSFIYGMARSLPYAVCILVLGILCYFYLTSMKDYRHIKQFADDYKNIESYESLIRNGIIKVVNGEQCLELRLAKAGNNIYGQVYEFDAKKKVVNVPLGKPK